MRKAFLLSMLVMAINFSEAQKKEFSVHLGSGFFSFQGAGATNNTYSYFSQYYGFGIGNPYGKTPGFSIFTGAEFMYVSKSNFLLGVGGGVEYLTAKAHIDTMVYSAFYIIKCLKIQLVIIEIFF